MTKKQPISLGYIEPNKPVDTGIIPNTNEALYLTNDTSGKIGRVLNNHDILFLLKKEQKEFIPLIAEIYGINFIIEANPIGDIVSQTSLKCLLKDEVGNKYFLKQKPFYSIDEQELAYDFQNYLSENTGFVPNIIKTIDCSNYFKIGNNYYFLTPFIEGTYFSGELEQSISCAQSLAEIHNKKMPLTTILEERGIEDELNNLIKLVLQKNNIPELVILIGNIQGIIQKYGYSDLNKEIIVLHRDFAPFNMVFDQNNNVIGVNDFDNCCLGSSLIDLSELLVTHTAINYAGITSHMREPISNFLDMKRFKNILYEYLSRRNNFNTDALAHLPNNLVLIWIELMLVGLLRGDFSITAISENLNFTDLLFNESKTIVTNEIEYSNFRESWNKKLIDTIPEYANEVAIFSSDEKLGLRHSFEVFKKSMLLREKIKDTDIDNLAIEHLAIFHDIGKFFQELHSLENISIAENIFQIFAERGLLDKNSVNKVLDGIKGSDFYNYRLDPSSAPPKFPEGDIVRCADKMQDNLVSKVDRYWFEYGVPRGAIFFDQKLTLEERKSFSFDNFFGDQLNVILSILGLRKEDFGNEVLGQEYGKWADPEKQKVVNRIVGLAKEIGYNEHQVEEIKKIISWYRSEFNC